MTRNILCAVYLLIAISAVHSASYYRFGRELVVPTMEDVKEVISELKKDDPVVVEEIVAIAGPEIVQPIVKTIPMDESVEPVVETVENNVVADVVAEKVVAEIVSDEGRAKPNPVLRFDTLEVIQPGAEKSEKVSTVAETVKNAAVQAIEKQNQETAESVKIAEPVVPEVKDTPVVDAPVVKSIPVVETVVEQVVEPVVELIVEPVVETVDASVKSPEPVVKDESVVPVVEAKNVVKESVRSTHPEPLTPEEPAQPIALAALPAAEPAQPEEKPEKSDKVEAPQPAEKSVETPVQPAVRQQTPFDTIQNALSTFTNNIQTNFQNAIQTFQTPLFNNNANKPQSDANPPAAVSGALNVAEQAPATTANAVQAAAAGTTAAPNFLQNVQQAITQIANNIIPAQLRPTAAPAAVEAPEPPVVVSGTRGGDETVQVVHNIDIDVSDKVDLAKKSQ